MEVRLETFSFSYPPIHMDDQLSLLGQKALAQIHLSTRSLTTTWLLRTTRYLFFHLFIWCIHPSQIIKTTSTPISSLESGWSNFQTDGGFVPVEQYHSLQVQYDEMHQEHINLMKELVHLEAKNSVLKNVS